MRKKAAAAQAARRPAAPAAPPPQAARPQPTATPFDGQLNDQEAADTAALRRSVRGVVDMAEPEASPPEDDLFDEGIKESTPVSSDAESGDDFGISAALKESMGDDFPDFDAGDDDDYEDEDYDEDDFLARRRADQRRQSEREALGRQRKLMTVGWGGLVAFLLFSLFYVPVFEEENLRHYFPGTANFVYGIFDGASDRERFRPEEGETLTPSPAEAEVYVRALLYEPGGWAIETRGGEQGLALNGYVENAGTTGASVPQVRAMIKDRDGNILDSWIINPRGLILRRQQKLPFDTFRSPVPPGAYNVEVKVIEGSRSVRDARDE